MYNFSVCISDEITESFEEKLIACSQLLMQNIEIEEMFDGKKLAELSGNELEYYRNLLITHFKAIVIYSCSEAVENLEYYKILFRKAHLLNIKNIKIKSTYKFSDDSSMDEFVQNFKKIVDMGKSFGVGVLLENQSGTDMAEDSQISEIFKSVKDSYLGLIFNPLEFVKLKKHPFFHVFYNSKLKNNICFLRVNDGLFENEKGVFPGEGNAEIKELASILLSRGSDVNFSFIPYMDIRDMNAYKEVIKKFKNMLMEM